MNNHSLSSKYINKIEEVIRLDEHLMRLLVYKPEDDDNPDPLSPTLPNIVHPIPNPFDEDEYLANKDNIDKYYELVNKHIVKGSKNTDIRKDADVIIYIHLGRKRPIFHNKTLSKQEVKINIYIHQSYEIDNRIDRISDRLSALLMGEVGIAGIGELQYVGSNERDAPINYRKQEEIYLYNTGIKRKR